MVYSRFNPPPLLGARSALVNMILLHLVEGRNLPAPCRCPCGPFIGHRRDLEKGDNVAGQRLEDSAMETRDVQLAAP
jgi:hypothetical protein